MNKAVFYNLLAFLTLMFGDGESLLRKSPDYIVEKFRRYMESTEDMSQWGLHPILKRDVFNQYLEDWKIQLDNLFEKKDE